MGSRLSITPPADFVLARDVCSYGYFLLWPNYWSPEHQTLTRGLELPGGPAAVVIGQANEAPGAKLSARFDRALDRADQAEAKRQIARMLRLNETESDLGAFHKADRRWKMSGRGRLFCSPTLFEDIVKTVTSCNVAWPNTCTMNRRLCEVVGRATPTKGIRTFPTAAKLSRTRPGTLRARCRVGYRDQRMVDLAKLFKPRGTAANPKPPAADPAWFEDPSNSDDDVFAALLKLPGVGPYAAGNIMQLLGRYSRLAVDTETVRHAKSVLGMTGADRKIMKDVEAHYARFGDHRFRSYWFELWDYYESKRGPAHGWDRDGVGRSFTASQLD